MVNRVVPSMAAKEIAKLMAWGLGPDWQAANATAPITNVVNGVRRGVFIAANPSTPNQSKVGLGFGVYLVQACGACTHSSRACSTSA